MVPTAFAFFVGIGLLAGLEPDDSEVAISMPLRAAVAICSVAAALLLATVGYRLVTADLALARVRRSLDEDRAGDPGGTALLWQTAKTRRSSGVTADLYFSRRMAAASVAAQDPVERVRLAGLAIDAARLSVTVPEQRQNAWYNLAILAAARDDPATVESSLRSAISAGPRWFKPHWALARLLYSAGRVEEARREANLALDLDGRRDPEVVATTAEIVRSLDSRR
jgi:tetratricopeptide (TPR) repeat protein